VTDTSAAQHRIAVSRDRLAAKIAELRKRETRVRVAIAPIRHLASPWLRLGLAAFVGYRLGRRAPTGNPGVALIPRAPSLVGELLRAGAMTVAASIMRRVADEIIGKYGHSPSSNDDA
jgi:hypothetical protein